MDYFYYRIDDNVFGPLVTFYVLYQLFAANVDEGLDQMFDKDEKNDKSDSGDNPLQRRQNLFSESELKTIKLIIYAIIILSLFSYLIKIIDK